MTVRTLGLLAFAPLAAALAAGCGDDAAGPPRSCVGQTCSGIGTCVEEIGYAYCACPPEHHPVGLTCVPDHASVPCDGVTCFDRGWCRIGSDGDPTCECFPGYRLSGGSDLVCLPELVFPDADVGTDVDADGPAEDGAGDAEAADDGAEAETGCVGELGGPCNLVSQCGCDPAEQCRVAVLPAVTEACGTIGDAPVGSLCNMLEDRCVPRAACLPLLGRLACEQVCYLDGDCSSGLGCIHDILTGTAYGLCSPPATPCDPYGAAGTDCPADHACRVTLGLALFTYCSPVGSVDVGGACVSDNCVAGSGCYVLDRSTPTCRRYCNIATPDACGAGLPGPGGFKQKSDPPIITVYI
jgi:hypothetical protein